MKSCIDGLNGFMLKFNMEYSKLEDKVLPCEKCEWSNSRFENVPLKGQSLQMVSVFQSA